MALTQAAATRIVPAIGDLSAGDYSAWLAEAVEQIPGLAEYSASKPALYDRALANVIGHLLMSTRADRAGATGPVSSYSAGDTSVSFGSAPQGMTPGSDDYWRTTAYGLAYLRIRAMLRPLHMVL